MARIKQNAAIPNLSSKIGGQSIANTQRGSYVRNITQTNTAGTPLQKKQRFSTAYLSQLWSTLSPAQIKKWKDTKDDYKYINRKGIKVDRLRFGVYLFINQNRNVFDESPVLVPPVYTQAFTIKVGRKSVVIDELEIESLATYSNQIYALFSDAIIGKGATMRKGRGVLTGFITSNQLKDGFDILPMIKTVYPTIKGDVNLGIFLQSYVANNFNSDQFPIMYNYKVTVL